MSRVGRVLLGVILAAVVGSAAACSSSASTTGTTTTKHTMPTMNASMRSGMPSASMPMMPGSASASGSVSTGTKVQVKNFAFTPQNLTVPVGATVTWTFVDSVQHTVTAVDNSFTSQPLSSGQTYQHTFTKAGTYAYRCSIHPFMTGSVIVK